MDKENIINVGKKFLSIRKQLNLNQIQMAKKLNISRAQYSKIERGIVYPNTCILHLLSTQYHISLDWLMTGKGEMIIDENKENEEKKGMNFGDDKETLEELIEIMARVPMVRYAVFRFFVEYFEDNKDIIEKTMNEYKMYKKISGKHRQLLEK